MENAAVVFKDAASAAVNAAYPFQAPEISRGFYGSAFFMDNVFLFYLYIISCSVICLVDQIYCFADTRLSSTKYTELY